MDAAIIVFASARRHGNTGKLTEWIAEELDIDIVDLGEKRISPYDYQHKNIDDDFIPLCNHLLDHQKIIFATPVYWYGPCAQMKTFIDRTSDFLDVDSLADMGRRLRSKSAYIISTSIGEDADRSFLDSLKNTFSYLGMNYGGYVHANCKDGYLRSRYVKDVDNFIEAVKTTP